MVIITGMWSEAVAGPGAHADIDVMLFEGYKFRVFIFMDGV